MRALDLDMDFFLSNTCDLAPVGHRPSKEEAEPWSEAEVRAFLEDNCGLSRKRPIPGAIFETHDGALRHWEALPRPIAVDHIDAHSDLGIGHPGPAYVLETVLAQPPEKRPAMDHTGKLDEANYLLFALAYRWVKSLNNVRNPGSRPDLPARIVSGEHLRLSSTLGKLMPQYDFREPPVPYRQFDDFRDFRAEGAYGFASLAISPRYAPQEADFIAEIFREYVKTPAR